MISEQFKMEIVAAFQQSLKKDVGAIKNLTLQELRDTDAMLGAADLNAGYRIALRNRIKEIEESDRLVHESKIRAFNFAAGAVVALLIAGATKYLFG